MAVTFQDYINALKSNIREPIVKVELLNADEQVIDIWDVDIISGNIQLESGSGSTRSCNLLMQNTHGLYIPIPEEQLWINTKIRLWSGLRIDGEDYFISRGIFVIGDPEINSLMAEKTANLSFYDKWALLDGTLGGELDSEYIIPVGTNIETAVRAIFTSAGDVKNPIITATDIATPYTLVGEIGGTLSDLLVRLSEMISWEVFYDSNGYGRFQPPADLKKTGSSWDFSENEVNYLGGQHRYDYSKVRNAVRIVGDNVLGQLFSGTAEDNNLTSPTRIELIGRRQKIIVDDLIFSNDLCQARANYELRNSIALFESANFSSIPIDILSGGSIVTITDTSAGFNGERFLINSINFPLLNEERMSINAWMTRDFS